MNITISLTNTIIFKNICQKIPKNLKYISKNKFYINKLLFKVKNIKVTIGTRTVNFGVDVSRGVSITHDLFKTVGQCLKL